MGGKHETVMPNRVQRSMGFSTAQNGSGQKGTLAAWLENKRESTILSFSLFVNERLVS
jgi:hypothetical protein